MPLQLSYALDQRLPGGVYHAKVLKTNQHLGRASAWPHTWQITCLRKVLTRTTVPCSSSRRVAMLVSSMGSTISFPRSTRPRCVVPGCKLRTAMGDSCPKGRGCEALETGLVCTEDVVFK